MGKQVGKQLIAMLLMLFAAVAISNASPVDSLQALEVAKQFLTQPSSSGRFKARNGINDATIVYTHKMPKSNHAAFYLVNVGDDSFVIVSADDVAYQILGYGLNKRIPVAKDGSIQLPPHVKSFFDDLAIQMEVAAETKENNSLSGKRKKAPSVSPSRRAKSLPESVEPLLSTTWDQGSY